MISHANCVNLKYWSMREISETKGDAKLPLTFFTTHKTHTISPTTFRAPLTIADKWSRLCTVIRAWQQKKYITSLHIDVFLRTRIDRSSSIMWWFKFKMLSVTSNTYCEITLNLIGVIWTGSADETGNWFCGLDRASIAAFIMTCRWYG